MRRRLGTAEAHYDTVAQSSMAMKILAISGSLQAGSSNTTLLRIAQSMALEDIEVVLYASLADLPYFNPDLDRDPAPTPVADLRAQLLAADGVLLASPEYAHGIPGALKNALDWVVGSGELYAKPVAVLSASPRSSGGAYAREAIERTLRHRERPWSCPQPSRCRTSGPLPAKGPTHRPSRRSRPHSALLLLRWPRPTQMISTLRRRS